MYYTLNYTQKSNYSEKHYGKMINRKGLEAFYGGFSTIDGKNRSEWRKIIRNKVWRTFVLN